MVYKKHTSIALYVGAISVAIFVFIKNAWVSEDAYIIFRSIEQLFAGNGPIWNPHERVQVFTSPLWYSVLAIARLFSADAYINVVIVSFALYLSTILVLHKVFKDNGILLISVLMFSASTAFHDFTSSGLENSLAYFLIAAYIFNYLELFKNEIKDNELETKYRIKLVLLLFGLVICVRHDLILLFLPATIYVISKNIKLYSAKHWTLIFMLCLIPFALYTLFSLIYYGFIFPNTAYAKLNTSIGKAEIIKQGFSYYYASLNYDSITLLAILAALVFGLFVSSKKAYKYLIYGVILNLVYVCYIGGDFMQGRFLSYAYLVSVIILSLMIIKLNPIKYNFHLILLLYLIFYTHTPFNSSFEYRNEMIKSGVADERGFYFNQLSLHKYIFHNSDSKNYVFPNLTWAKNGYKFKESSSKAIVSSNIGIFGYYSGVDKIIVDDLALSDPLLARMPVRGWWRIGHFKRNIPEGYIASILNDNEIIADPKLNKYYRKLKIITQSEKLFSLERMKTILLFNIGAYDYLISEA